MLREREDAIRETIALKDRIRVLEKLVSALRNENERLQMQVEKARAAGVNMNIVELTPDDLVKSIRAQTSVLRIVKPRAKKIAPSSQDNIEYDTTWQVEDGNDAEGLATGTEHTL